MKKYQIFLSENFQFLVVKFSVYLNLRKHAYLNILKILSPKNENFQTKKNLIFFLFLLKTWIVGTR